MASLTQRQTEAMQLLRLHRQRSLWTGPTSASPDIKRQAVAAELAIEERIVQLVEEGRRSDRLQLVVITIGLIAGAIAYWPVRLLGGRR